MRLFLLRHGIAIDQDDPGCPDDRERYLTKVGIEKTERACRGLASLGFQPQAVISSPLVRARQTAELAVSALGFEGEIEQDEALAWMYPPPKFLARLSRRTESGILVTGHAPHLDDLVGLLCGSERAFTSIKKAGTVELHCINVAAGGAYLIAHYPPRVLRALG